MSLGEKIIDFRTVKQLTQVEAAEMLGVSRETIIAIENKKREPHATTKRKIEIYIENNM